MTNPFLDQKNFMEAGDQTTDEYDIKQKYLYESLIIEEYEEFNNAVDTEPLANQIKEACDMIVVLIGWLYSVGVKPWYMWELVHKNNMLKVANPPVKNADGKITKSPEAIKGKIIMMHDINEEING